MRRLAAAPGWFTARWRQSLVFSFTVIGVVVVAFVVLGYLGLR